MKKPTKKTPPKRLTKKQALEQARITGRNRGADLLHRLFMLSKVAPPEEVGNLVRDIDRLTIAALTYWQLKAGVKPHSNTQ